MKSNRTIKTKKPTITKKLKIKEEDICQQLADFAETTRVRKVPIKSFTERPHTNFADEIQSQKTDKFLDRAFYTIVSIVVILGIISLIVNLPR